MGVGEPSVAAPASGNMFTFAPNPASDFITLQGNLPQNGQLVITSLNGAVQKSFAIDANMPQAIPLTGLPNGLYLVTIAGTEGNRATQKLAIMRAQN